MEALPGVARAARRPGRRRATAGRGRGPRLERRGQGRPARRERGPRRPRRSTASAARTGAARPADAASAAEHAARSTAPRRGRGSAAATRRTCPLGPDGAPPEEPHDGDAAALVAGLDDEVLVVDEHPRYHLDGCPSLGNSPVIPLPAREAVELGLHPVRVVRPGPRARGQAPRPGR